MAGHLIFEFSYKSFFFQHSCWFSTVLQMILAVFHSKSITTFIFCLFFFKELLEEDKLHSNGGNVLPSEFKSTHSGRSLSTLSFLLLLPHFKLKRSFLCYDSCSSALACVWTHVSISLMSVASSTAAEPAPHAFLASQSAENVILYYTNSAWLFLSCCLCCC